MGQTEHQLRMKLLGWVQKHTIMRRSSIRFGWRTKVMSDNEAVEELLECVSALKVPYYDRYTSLTEVERMQVEAVAQELVTRCGAYQGSTTDAITDAIGIVKAATFAPPLGDNHHNALECPHCTQRLLQEPPQGS